MKTPLTILAALLLSGCVTARYSATETEEYFKLTSFFKSVDGLYTEKGDGKFTMKIDKTHTQDPMSNMLEILKMIQAIKDGKLVPVVEPAN